MIGIVQAGLIPITIACFLQLSFPLDTTFAEVFGHTIAKITAVALFGVYPLLMLSVGFMSKETLQHPDIKQRIGTIYDGHRLDTFGQRTFRLIF